MVKKTLKYTKDSKEEIHPEEQISLVKRMNRIIGQVQGVKKMIEEERNCMEILSQITAIKSALDGVAMVVLEQEAEKCFQTAIEKNQNKEQALKEFITMVRKYTK
jgi:DNA-binding FrmR family transcriptional regulator